MILRYKNSRMRLVMISLWRGLKVFLRHLEESYSKNSEVTDIYQKRLAMYQEKPFTYGSTQDMQAVMLSRRYRSAMDKLKLSMKSTKKP